MLHRAIQSNDLNALLKALERYYKDNTLSQCIDEPNAQGLTSLQLAANLGRVDMIWFLVSAGATLDPLTDSISSELLSPYAAKSPLLLAWEAGHFMCAYTLILMGSRPIELAPADLQFTAEVLFHKGEHLLAPLLYKAIAENNASMIKRLNLPAYLNSALHAGPLVDEESKGESKDEKQIPAPSFTGVGLVDFWAQVKSSNKSMLDALLQKQCSLAGPSEGPPLLALAAIEKDSELIQKCLTQGADPHKALTWLWHQYDPSTFGNFLNELKIAMVVIEPDYLTTLMANSHLAQKNIYSVEDLQSCALYRNLSWSAHVSEAEVKPALTMVTAKLLSKALEDKNYFVLNRVLNHSSFKAFDTIIHAMLEKKRALSSFLLALNINYYDFALHLFRTRNTDLLIQFIKDHWSYKGLVQNIIYDLFQKSINTGLQRGLLIFINNQRPTLDIALIFESTWQTLAPIDLDRNSRTYKKWFEKKKSIHNSIGLERSLVPHESHINKIGADGWGHVMTFLKPQDALGFRRVCTLFSRVYDEAIGSPEGYLRSLQNDLAILQKWEMALRKNAGKIYYNCNSITNLSGYLVVFLFASTMETLVTYADFCMEKNSDNHELPTGVIFGMMTFMILIGAVLWVRGIKKDFGKNGSCTMAFMPVNSLDPVLLTLSKNLLASYTAHYRAELGNVELGTTTVNELITAVNRVIVKISSNIKITEDQIAIEHSARAPEAKTERALEAESISPSANVVSFNTESKRSIARVGVFAGSTSTSSSVALVTLRSVDRRAASDLAEPLLSSNEVRIDIDDNLITEALPKSRL